jgi:hypothetical protein
MISTFPVSLSISTMQAWAPNGNVSRHAQGVDAQLSSGSGGRSHGFSDCLIHFQKHRCDALVKPAPRGRRRDTSGRAIEQANVEPAFELADDLAQCRTGYTQVFPGSPAELRFVFELECGKLASLEITP